MEHMKIVKKSTPIYSKVYWNFFIIFMYKSKTNNKLELFSLYIAKTGANFVFYIVAPVLYNIDINKANL